MDKKMTVIYIDESLLKYLTNIIMDKKLTVIWVSVEISHKCNNSETIYNLLELNQSEWVDEYGCYNSSILKNTIQYQKYTEVTFVNCQVNTA